MPRTRADTICALATAAGRSALAVVRVSGPDAFAVLGQVFPAAHSNRLPARRARTGWLVDEAGGRIDQAVVVAWHGPNSYTGEDLVEISCHGSPLVTDRLLGALIAHGCRRAEPGEFTRRAVLAGKLTLSQAEAIADIVDATSPPALAAALDRYQGASDRLLAVLAGELRELAAAFEHHVSFDESEAEVPVPLVRRRADLLSRLKGMVADARRSRLLNEGCRVAIVGRSNVGKSTLFNRLLGTERAVVAPSPGTTRDRVEAGVALGDARMLLADTAGITARPAGQLARAAAARTEEAIRDADLVLTVFDSSQPVRAADRAVLAAAAGRPGITVLNKADLPARFDATVLNGHARFSVSALTGRNVGRLRSALARRVRPGTISPLGSARHVGILEDCLAALERSAAAPDAELAALEVRNSLETVDRAAAPDASAAILDRVFARFCVGK